jgi:hypothetical protein
MEGEDVLVEEAKTVALLVGEEVVRGLKLVEDEVTVGRTVIAVESVD